MLANETVAGQGLIDALRRRAEEGPIRVTVICPQNEPRAGYVVYEDERRSAAERRLRRTLDLLHEAGIAARGAVVDPDPLHALRDGLAEYEPDEVIISTHPEERSSWLRGNLIDRARKAAAPVPVEHIVVDLNEPRELAHVLVIGSETVVGAPLLAAVRDRAQAVAVRVHRRRPGRPARRRAAHEADGRAAQGGGSRGDRPRGRPRSRLRSREHRARRARGRDHRLDLPAGDVRLDAPRRDRADQEADEAAGDARRGRTGRGPEGGGV